ncbi:MAG TPA: galactose-1-phosphate uridylyltransferase [Limnochordia bacterium]|nr:galactose-1-phosphate uridylyltransferase [Limnochordia bacterium]
MSELRRHPFLGTWVITATHRQDRTFMPPKDFCPLCPTRPGAHPTEIPAEDFEIVVFDNRFPSLQSPPPEPAIGPRPYAPVRPAAGVCEVVVYSPDHETTLAELPRERVVDLVRVWTERYTALCRRPEVEYVFIFENRGEAVGVTLSHPHGQIYAYSFIPPVLATELAHSAAYHDEHGRCLMCDILADERAQAVRLVAENRHFVAFIPFFARYPYEVYLAPKGHRTALPEFSAEESASFAAILQAVVKKYDALFGFTLPYIMAMHQAPAAGAGHYHFHVEFYPPNRTATKLKWLAGSESGAGTFINDAAAEAKAAELRAAGPQSCDA